MRSHMKKIHIYWMSRKPSLKLWPSTLLTPTWLAYKRLCWHRFGHRHPASKKRPREHENICTWWGGTWKESILYEKVFSKNMTYNSGDLTPVYIQWRVHIGGTHVKRIHGREHMKMFASCEASYDTQQWWPLSPSLHTMGSPAHIIGLDTHGKRYNACVAIQPVQNIHICIGIG